MPLTDSAPTLTPHKHARTARCRLLVLMWFGVFLFSLVPLCVQCVLSICFLVCVRLLLFSPSLPCPAFVSVQCLCLSLPLCLCLFLSPCQSCTAGGLTQPWAKAQRISLSALSVFVPAAAVRHMLLWCREVAKHLAGNKSGWGPSGPRSPGSEGDLAEQSELVIAELGGTRQKVPTPGGLPSSLRATRAGAFTAPSGDHVCELRRDAMAGCD